MRTLAFVAVAVASACSGSAPATTVDSGSAACTKALYDPCATEHDCLSGNCQTFPDVGSNGIEVCSQACGSGSACPDDATGAPGTCDATYTMCRPAQANACVPPLG